MTRKKELLYLSLKTSKICQNEHRSTVTGMHSWPKGQRSDPPQICWIQEKEKKN